MQRHKNKVVIACAGSGKTSRLVSDALSHCDRRIAIITYTNNNIRAITKKFEEQNSGVPKHVDVMTWFTFLLRECARPYQRSLYNDSRIESLQFVSQRSAIYAREADVRAHYFANEETIYSDKIAKFVVNCNLLSGQKVLSRLGQIYTDIFIDEFQDLAGWDLEIIELLLESDIRITLVGDPRQHIYSTNPAAKNKAYQGVGVLKLVEKWEKAKLCECEVMDGSHRCNQAICDFVNALWPGMPPMKSLSTTVTDHDGVFLVSESNIEQYLEHYRPQVLRYDKRAKSYSSQPLNFGLSKGLQFDRVLVVPTGLIGKYLKEGDLTHVKGSKDKLHVAVTRARYSVAFVFGDHSKLVPNRYLTPSLQG